MRLGVLVVYLLAPQDRWVLDMHLDRMARTRLPAGGSFTVYAAAPRLPEPLRAVLRARDFVEIVDLPTSPLRMNAEHGTLLDALAVRALADGCDHICTFDADSWPIRDDWPEAARARIEAEDAVGAAALRVENGDHVLPHPSFCMLKAEAFADPACRFWLPPEEMEAPFHAFLGAHRQRIDTGIAIAYSLHRRGLRWVRLLRSNRVDHHRILAGIYGDLVFHLGAVARVKRFVSDTPSWASRLTAPLAATPGAWRIRAPLVAALERMVEPSAFRHNRQAFERIVAELRADEAGFYRALVAGETPRPGGQPDG